MKLICKSTNVGGSDLRSICRRFIMAGFYAWAFWDVVKVNVKRLSVNFKILLFIQYSLVFLL
jgi:hypothetical protein